MEKFKRGFTLIELLIVIIIVGLLAGIVTAMLNTARTRAAVAGAKSNMNGTRAQGENFATSNNNSYNGGAPESNVCNAAASAGGVGGVNPGVLAAARNNNPSADVLVNVPVQLADANYGICHSTADGWAAEVMLKDGNFYCVDSTNAGKVNDSNMLGYDITSILCQIVT